MDGTEDTGPVAGAEPRLPHPEITPAHTWGTWREAREVVTLPSHLRATLSVAAVVGTILLVINQLDTVLQGHIGPGLLVKALLNYVVPFLVSNYGLLAATRRHSRRPH